MIFIKLIFWGEISLKHVYFVRTLFSEIVLTLLSSGLFLYFYFGEIIYFFVLS